MSYINYAQNRKAKIIDLQSPVDYNNYHLRGAVNIPYDELLNNYRKYLNKNETYCIYCKSGKLSKRVVAMLSYLGYNVIKIDN